MTRTTQDHPATYDLRDACERPEEAPAPARLSLEGREALALLRRLADGRFNPIALREFLVASGAGDLHRRSSAEALEEVARQPTLSATGL
jgi:hypothetical protein